MSHTNHRPLPEAKLYCPTLSLRKVHEEGALLVDVLAFDAADMIHIPMSELERRHAELPRDRLLVLACATGERSLKATYFLMHDGYSQVANLEGGMTKWVRKGFPVKGDPALAAPGGGCCQTPDDLDPAAANPSSCSGVSHA